ncbi:MAG: ankyrin repeat domain-containing protein [Candidatus Dependentiae bacterium]|nr:ankyrin repeat domain-containing protein [Candidatus Dependentiae bacterium]
MYIKKGIAALLLSTSSIIMPCQHNQDGYEKVGNILKLFAHKLSFMSIRDKVSGGVRNSLECAPLDVNAFDSDGQIPLTLAVQPEPFYKVGNILKLFAHKLLCMSIRDQVPGGVRNSLERTTLDVNAFDSDGQTPLTLAVQPESSYFDLFPVINADIVCSLLDAQADPMAKNSAGQTPIGLAIKARDVHIVGLLLKALECRQQLTDELARKAVMLAAQNKDSSMLKMLIESGGNPHLKGYRGFTPLMRAAENNDAKSIYLLMIKSKVNPNEQNDEGLTAFMIAAQNGHCNAAQALVDCSKIVAAQTTGLALRGSIRNKQGKTVYDLTMPNYMKAWLKEHARR